MPFPDRVHAAVIDTQVMIDELVEHQVFYNGIVATAFATIKNGRLYFKHPFPARDKPFTLEVTHQASGEVLHHLSYRIVDRMTVAGQHEPPAYNSTLETQTPANENDDFDQERDRSVEIEREFEHSAQLDVSALSSADDGSDFEKREFEQEGESDLLANFTATTKYQSMLAGLELEAVHRSNPDSSVRYDGPPADVSRFLSSLEFSAADGSVFYLNAGDVEVGSANSLVNTGISSRGFSIGFIAPDEKFKWEVGRFYGQDIVGMVRGPIGLSTESYRIGTSAGFKLLSRDNIDWSVHLSMLNVKRDVEDAFATGESQSGETNHVWGFGSDFEIFDRRLKLSFAWARSDYDNPEELNTDNLPEGDEFVIYSPGVTSGNAYRHLLKWNAWNNDVLSRSVDLEFSAERAEPFYRSIHGESTADRRQWSLYADFTSGPVTVRIGTTQYQNNLDRLISIHTLDEAVHEAEVTLDVVSIREVSADTENYSATVLPSTIAVRAVVEELKTVNGDDIILAPVIEGFDFMDQVNQTLGLSLAWDRENNSTSLDIDYTYFDNSQRERANADSRDLVFTLSHSIHRDNWSVSGRAAISTSDDLDVTSRSTTDLSEWGLSGSYTTEAGLVVSAGFDSSVNKHNDRVADENEDTDSQVYSLSVDMGSWLAQQFGWSIEPSVTASWQRSNTDNRSIYYTNDQMSESLSVKVGVPF